MSNPFDDLEADDEETIEAAETAESEPKTDSGQTEDDSSTGDPQFSKTDDEPSTGSDTQDESVEKLDGDSAENPDDDPVEKPDELLSPGETGPAFEYSEVQQKPFYARTVTVNEFENKIRTTIVPQLANAEVLDEETREIHDAVLRLANEQPERVAELVLQERRQSGSQ